MIEVEGPDGVILEFPDGTPRETIQSAMEKRYAGGSPAKRTAMSEATGALAVMNEAIPLGDEFRDAVATPFAMTTDALRSPKAFLEEAGRAWNEVRGRQRGIAGDFEKRRPVTSNLIRGATTGATMFVPAAGQAQLYVSSGKAANMLRGATTSGLTAAGYAAADRGSAAERVGAASRAASDPVILGLGAAGGAMAPSRRRAPRQRVSPQVNLLRKEGVPITLGRQGGRVAAAMEDAATSIPFAGDAILARQRESLEGFNRAVGNRALKEIDESLPGDVPVGRDAVKFAGDRLSAAYDKVLPEIGVRLDRGYATDSRVRLAPLMETMGADAQKRLLDIVDTRVHAQFGDGVDAGILSGDRYKLVERGLDFEITRFGKSQDPDQQAIAEGLKVVKAALGEAAERQNPKFAQAKEAVDRGWATLAQMENAAAKAGTAAEDGVFTPKQFDAAVRAGDKRVRHRGYARGEALNQDLATAGASVLSSKVPDSGTGRRLMQGGGVIGGVTGAFIEPTAALTTAATVGGVTALYSRRGQELADALLARRLNRQAAEAAMAELAELAAKDPKAAALYADVSERLSRLAGAERGSPALEPRSRVAP